MKRIFLYGLAGASDAYRIVKYSYIDDEYRSIKDIKLHAYWLKSKNPSIKYVFAIDERPGLAADYTRAWKQNSIESYAIFKDILEREGVLIV